MARGLFITLEGGEGVGKSTQIKLLEVELKSHGKDVLLTREPGGSGGAEAIRTLLMTGEDDKWSARSEALLFAAARADHVEKTILPALASGQWVLCDRFIDSTRAYQGGAGGLPDEDIMALHRVGSQGLLPDVTILLDLPITEGAQRTAKRDGDKADRMGSKAHDYYERVAERFRTMAAAEPERFYLVDASGDEAAVTARILAALEPYL